MSELVHIVIAFLVLLGLLFLNFAGILPYFQDYGRKAVEFLEIPLVATFSLVKNSSQVLVRLSDIYKQNLILSEQVQELSGEVARLEKMSQENRILREALGFEQETNLKLTPAEVITRDFLESEQKLILNRGSSDGVASGAAVVVSGRVMVGVISEVAEHTSEMQVLTSSAVAINAEDAVTGATGIARGEHGLGMLFDLVSQDQPIKAGDDLVTSGLGGSFPKSLLIGKIAETRSGQEQLFQKASVIPAAGLQGLRFVFIVKKPR